MKKIGLLSDTHGYLHPKAFNFFADCDEIWHAGDIGGNQVAEKLSEFKTFKAVYGNIDGLDIRSVYPRHVRFKCEDTDVWITHIGGYPGKYDKLIKDEIYSNPPKLFICGHSHILKVMPDKKLNLLFINPGAAGISGFHKVITMLKFCITKAKVHDLKVIELPKKVLLEN
jgi:putative phosphoesterase